jgi:hypothetical protein
MRTNEDQTTKSTTTAAGTANQDSIKDAATGSENSNEKRQVTIPSAPSAQDRASKADANRRGDSDSNEL